MRKTCSPVLVSQTRSVPSLEAVKHRLVMGEKPTALIKDVWLVSVNNRSPVCAFQRIAVLSALPVSALAPSGESDERATALTTPTWPMKVCSRLLALDCQRRAVLSGPPARKFAP